MSASALRYEVRNQELAYANCTPGGKNASGESTVFLKTSVEFYFELRWPASEIRCSETLLRECGSDCCLHCTPLVCRPQGEKVMIPDHDLLQISVIRFALCNSQRADSVFQ